MPVSIFEVIPDSGRAASGLRFNRAGGRRRRDGGHQVVLEEPAEIADAHRAKHEDAGADPRRPERNRLLDVGARQHLRSGLLERTRDRPRAMAVRVRLDDGNHRRGRAARRLGREKVCNRAVIGRDRVEVDLSEGGTEHAADQLSALCR